MAVSAAYSVDSIVDAISNADTYIYTAAFTGSYVPVDLVIDADLALKQAGLTERQSEVIYYRWVQGLTQEETGTLLGVKQQTIMSTEQVALDKLSKVLEKWESEDAV